MRKALLITVILLITKTIIGQNDKDKIDKQLVSHNYFRDTGSRHPNPEKLIIKKTKKFTIRESNFKGIWITKGNWEVKGDTLILYKLKRTVKRKFYSHKENVTIPRNIEKFHITTDKLITLDKFKKLTFLH